MLKFLPSSMSAVWTSVMLVLSWNSSLSAYTSEVHSSDILFNCSTCFVCSVSQAAAHYCWVHVFTDIWGLSAGTQKIYHETQNSVNFSAEFGKISFSVSTGERIFIMLYSLLHWIPFISIQKVPCIAQYAWRHWNQVWSNSTADCYH